MKYPPRSPLEAAAPAQRQNRGFQNSAKSKKLRKSLTLRKISICAWLLGFLTSAWLLGFPYPRPKILKIFSTDLPPSFLRFLGPLWRPGAILGLAKMVTQRELY